MAEVVTIIDYGIGNLLSVCRAFEKCHANVVFADNPDKIISADKLVLPGVGAFSNGMNGLRKHELIEPLKAYAKTGKPLLGICLGMQMLFTSSDEFGYTPGLGLIKGKVSIITPLGKDGLPLKVPHIGWSQLNRVHGGAPWENSIFKDLKTDSHAYFVHSYTAVPLHENERLADAQYGSARISAAVKRDNLYGCQFHPEKSGPIGLAMIQNFVNL